MGPQPATQVPVLMIKIYEVKQQLVAFSVRPVSLDDVPVAHGRVELEREPTDVAFRIGRTPLASHRGEAGEHARLAANAGEDFPCPDEA